jgi:hypothetical protein
MAKSKKGPWESMLTGLVIAAGFGVVWALKPGAWWAVFPIVFAGVLPFIHGLQSLLAERRARPSAAELAARIEKEILRIARKSGGSLTPAIVALESDLTAERAEEALQGLTRRGYASMRVTDEGRVFYDFPEFQPPEAMPPGGGPTTT